MHAGLWLRHGYTVCLKTSSAPHPTDLPVAFTEADAEGLELLCNDLGARPWATGLS